MYRYKLEQIGIGNKVRIIAQYQHKAYGRLLLVNVSLLDDYITNGKDSLQRNYDNFFDVDFFIKNIDYFTDHVHLDISESNDKRLTEFRDNGDIIICTCEIYQYEYTNCFDEEICGNNINFALKNPTDIILLKPLEYSNNLVFLPQSRDIKIPFYAYKGQGSRSCIPSDWWNFTQLLSLPTPYESLSFDETSIVTHKGYEIVKETDTHLELWYAEYNNKIIVYKSIKNYLHLSAT